MLESIFCADDRAAALVYTGNVIREETVFQVPGSKESAGVYLEPTTEVALPGHSIIHTL
jgi:hypothetical protein